MSFHLSALSLNASEYIMYISCCFFFFFNFSDFDLWYLSFKVLRLRGCKQKKNVAVSLMCVWVCACQSYTVCVDNVFSSLSSSVQPRRGRHIMVHHSEGFCQRGNLRQGVCLCLNSSILVGSRASAWSRLSVISPVGSGKHQRWSLANSLHCTVTHQCD